MNENVIQEQYAHICSLLREKKLKDALSLLISLLSQSTAWELRAQVEQIQLSYEYMLEYMRRGVADPKRGEVYRRLLAETWEIAEQTRLRMLDESSSKLYHEIRRTNAILAGEPFSLLKALHILESFDDEMAISRLQSTDKEDEVLHRHEDTLRECFRRLWTNSRWSGREEEEANAALTSETIPADDLCLWVSAVTLSLMTCFDIRKAGWLLNACAHADVRVSRRALIGVVIVFHVHRERLVLYPELSVRMSIMSEDASFRDAVATVYRQFLLSQETEKIDKKMREDIIPEMMKNVPKMRGFRFGMEDEDEEKDGENPDWADRFESSGLGDKLREMNELQQEGADVYMSTFSHLKNYPFFREEQNWFYPFSLQRSDVVKHVRRLRSKEINLSELLVKISFMSNSDKYSLFFTLATLPENQREMVKAQLYEQQSVLSDKDFVDQMRQENERPESAGSQYIQDLYRFFKLYMRRQEFRDIFSEKLDFHRISLFRPFLSTSERLMTIADFYLRKERWEEAVEVYREVDDNQCLRDADATECYQRLGYALQKLKRYDEAIAAYRKAELLKPDSAWNNRHLAACYRLSRRFDSALEYYKKAEAVSPDDHNLVFHIATCLAESERYEESLNYFFKLDFLVPDSRKAARGIGWCSFMLRKHEQAMKYYEQVLNRSPHAIDYLNAAHVAWVMNDLPKAVSLYTQSAAACESREQFIELFRKDEDALLRQGIRGEDFPLMWDMIG